MNQARTYVSFKNSIVALIAQVTSIILSFVTRTFFIKYLSMEYLGINALFTDILTMLSFAELGIGTSIVYLMYKPLSEKDEYKIAALMNLYSKIYKYVGTFIAICGLMILPFLGKLIKDDYSISGIGSIYILYLINSVISYFFTYKRSIIIADQYGYIDKFNTIIFSLAQNIIQILVLIFTKNFYLYLSVQIMCTLLSNIFISVKANKMYPYLYKYRYAKVDKDTTNTLIKNVLAMVSSKLGSVIVSGTDALLISSFSGIKSVALYSNYKLLSNTVKSIIIQIIEPITATVGNLNVTESKEYSYKIFKRIYFINFIIAFFASTFLFTLINPFISIWIGEEYLLSTDIVFMIVLNLYVIQMRQPAIIYINTCGLFWQIKWKSIVEAIINLIVSLILLYYLDLGILGVLIGTFISNIFTNVWWEPIVVFKYGLNKSSLKYFKYFFIDSIVFIINIILVNKICILFNYSSIWQFIINFVLTLVVSTFIFIAIYYKREEFEYSINLIKNIVMKITKER